MGLSQRVRSNVAGPMTGSAKPIAFSCATLARRRTIGETFTRLQQTGPFGGSQSGNSFFGNSGNDRPPELTPLGNNGN